MKLQFSLAILLLTSFLSIAQNPVGFDKMAKKMAGKKTPIISKEDVDNLISTKKEVIFLDSREYSEYEVSHLPNAVWVGFDKINWASIEKIGKSTNIVVYCSVGYRSGKLTEQLLKKGFTEVKNLNGGLFNWANNGGILETEKEVPTKKVHGYNQNWSQWLNPKKVTVVF